MFYYHPVFLCIKSELSRMCCSIAQIILHLTTEPRELHSNHVAREY